MVRTVADRAFLPAKSLFEQVGNMMILTGKTITATVRPPYPYGGEFISQFIFALQLCWFPMLISTVAFGFGAPGLQAANFLTLFGALDRLGGACHREPRCDRRGRKTVVGKGDEHGLEQPELAGRWTAQRDQPECKFAEAHLPHQLAGEVVAEQRDRVSI